MRVFACDAEHVFIVPVVHAYEVVVFLIVAALHADCVFSGCGDSVLGELVPGAGVYGVADFFRAGGGGSDVELAGKTSLGYYVF